MWASLAIGEIKEFSFHLFSSNKCSPISQAKEGQVAVDAFVLITEICHNLNVKIKEIGKEENNQLSAHLAFPALNVTRVVAEIEPACGVGAGHTWKRDIRYPDVYVHIYVYI